jgi:cytochrome c oxidase assembly factor CtaG
VYDGPPELTLSRAVTSWTLDLPVLVAAGVAAGLYLAGMRRLHRAGLSSPPAPGAGSAAALPPPSPPTPGDGSAAALPPPSPAARAVAFLAGGTGAVVLATMSFLGVYQGVLFWTRAVQNVLLILVAPLFLALGRPLTLLIAALPRLGARAEAAVHSRAARILTFPAITAMVLVIVPFLLYFTPWYEAGLRNDLVRELTYAALMVPGLVFFWTLLRVDPVPRAYPYLVSLWVTGAEVVGDAVLGLAIIADEHLIAGSYYQALGRPWGPSLRADQVIGGGAVWILGDLVGLPFLAAMLIQMIREDEQEAAQVDAELDASAAAAQDAGVATAATAGSQPWWQSDSRFTGRFKAVDQGERPPG